MDAGVAYSHCLAVYWRSHLMVTLFHTGVNISGFLINLAQQKQINSLEVIVSITNKIDIYNNIELFGDFVFES